LLVSVRNVVEAESALIGGCDILDLKEPSRGPLGMVDVSMIDAVIDYLQGAPAQVPLSVALGEAIDWTNESCVPALSARIDYLKLGTAGLGSGAKCASQLREIKRCFEDVARETRNGRGETASDRRSTTNKRNWIAVAYADWRVAEGPAPEVVFEAAVSCGFGGVLIDTFSKERGGLFDWLPGARLASLANLAWSRHLPLALAGRLQIDQIPQLLAIGPQIVGIRSAACCQGIRTGAVDAAAVRDFRTALYAKSIPESF
jgi:hypothetical protein